MGNYAVKLLMNNIGNRVVAAQKEDVVDYDIFEALNMKKTIDMNLYDIAHEVSILNAYKIMYGRFALPIISSLISRADFFLDFCIFDLI